MDLNDTKDFTQVFADYCGTKSLSCRGCKMAKLSGIKGVHNSGKCLAWAKANKDAVVPILQEWWDEQPFIPQYNEIYYYVSDGGVVYKDRFDETACTYAFVLIKNCFRSEDAANNHKREILAKYAAIDKGKYPD